MTSEELKKRSKAFGITTSAELAHALGLDRAGAWRIWIGTRPVTERTIARLEAATKAMPRALSRDELRILDTANYALAGTPVTLPEMRHNIDQGQPWADMLKVLEADGFIRRSKLTKLGAKALSYYRSLYQEA